MDEFDKEIMLKIIGAKAQLIGLDLNKQKISTDLESIFKGLKLTKPKIALKLKDYIRVVDFQKNDKDSELEKNKKEDIKNLIEQIFGVYISDSSHNY